ncbi:Insect cuticle protein [Cinara cedri]|uniref:Insect cuticle protein n=1 Tax=Cinara cedri TaxID=506608 RepID=A0A5E4LZD2_9HEMI|nr:Insect cuticle protein [Cinara cedri]
MESQPSSTLAVTATHDTLSIVNSFGAMVSSIVNVLQVLFWSWALVGVATIASAAQDPGEKPTAVTESGEVTTPAAVDSAGGGNDAKQNVTILKQINKVNDDGSYTFGYEASDGSFKLETRDVAGNVKGMFGFVDEAGRLKRVSYSANNSSSASNRATGTTTSSPSIVYTVPIRTNNKGDDDEPGGKSLTAGVKKVLVSKRLVAAQSLEQEVQDKGREGNDLRRQLSRNDDDGDSPDVYGIHGGSGMDSATGPVSPVVSALMAELSPIRVYRPVTLPPSPLTPSSQKPQQQSLQPSTTLPAELDRQYKISSRQAQDDEEPPQYRQRVAPVRYRQPAPATEMYQQPEYQQPTYQPSSAYQPSPTYPVQLPAPLYQQQQQPIPIPVYGPNIVALRDELMELILSFIQTRVSQLITVASYSRQLPPTAPYPMPYQQPNYYVPSYYQGPRIPVSPAQPSGLGVRQIVSQQGYATGAVTDAAPVQQSSPKITQTLKDGLIRMLLSTSPRYEPEYAAGEQSTLSRLTYRRTTQSTPVRSVQIIGNDDSPDGSSRPVTTESPD